MTRHLIAVVGVLLVIGFGAAGYKIVVFRGATERAALSLVAALEGESPEVPVQALGGREGRLADRKTSCRGRPLPLRSAGHGRQ